MSREFVGGGIANGSLYRTEPDNAETTECLKVLRELLEVVENAEWTNPDMPSWEYDAVLAEATDNARKAIKLFSDN